jgi:hypothetical protein
MYLNIKKALTVTFSFSLLSLFIIQKLNSFEKRSSISYIVFKKALSFLI